MVKNVKKSAKQVLVIGGGITGLSAAIDLARLGIGVVIAEKSNSLGGHAAKLSCKATDRCVSCGACIVEQKIETVTSSSAIQIHLNTTVEKVSRNGHFEIKLKKDLELQDSCYVKADAILLAYGFTPFKPVKKPYGYDIFKNVITSLELDLQLRNTGRAVRPSDEAFPKKPAFIQCVGSRDSGIGNLWCSKICCGASLRAARLILHRQPETEISFYYIDVQTFGKNFQKYYSDTKKQIRLIRAIPADIVKTEQECLKLSYFDTDSQAYNENIHDLVILSIGIEPSDEKAVLGAAMEINLENKGGFLGRDFLPGGIFAAGTALEPMSIAESVASAGRSACEILAYLENKPAL